MADYSKKMEIAKELENIEGHPLWTFSKEDEALKILLNKAKELLEEKKEAELRDILDEIHEVAIHYAKKGDLLYPHLKVKYEISGPSDLMWTTDDEIREELSLLIKTSESNDEWYTRLQKVVKDMEDMIHKDGFVLYPICAVNFTEEEWIGIYRDSKDYPACFGVHAIWEKGEEECKEHIAWEDGEIHMPGGHMTLEQLRALLNIIPMEITFIDDQDRNIFFNEGSKVFKRPAMAIDREVYSCHPPKIEVQVRKIIEGFKSGELDKVPLWMEKNGKVMSVTYMAVRDKDGKYMGTVEFVQDMEHAKEYFGNTSGKEMK